MKQHVIGYVDLTRNEIKYIFYVLPISYKGSTMQATNKSKSLVKHFITKENKARLYKVVLIEVKK